MGLNWVSSNTTHPNFRNIKGTYQKQHRTCRCFVGDIPAGQFVVDTTDATNNPTECTNTAQMITENDCPFTFKEYCQPCIGATEQIANNTCEVNECPSDTELSNLNDDTVWGMTYSTIHYGQGS